MKKQAGDKEEQDVKKIRESRAQNGGKIVILIAVVV